MVNLKNFRGAYLDGFYIKLCETTIINFCIDSLASQVVCICKLTKKGHSLEFARVKCPSCLHISHIIIIFNDIYKNQLKKEKN